MVPYKRTIRESVVCESARMETLISAKSADMNEIFRRHLLDVLKRRHPSMKQMFCVYNERVKKNCS